MRFLIWIVASTMARAFSPFMECRRHFVQQQPSSAFRCVQLVRYPSSGTCPLWMTENISEEEKTPASEDEKSEEEGADQVSVDVVETKGFSRIQKIRRRLVPPKETDGLTFRQRLGKAGLSVALSYGWVSNVSYSVTVSLAWYIFSKKTRLSPLAPGQWKPFLAVYAGFYVFNNIVRPLRFALSVSVSIYFDRVVQGIQDKFKVKKSVAVGLTVFLANVVGTIMLMCLGISIASTAAGVPIWATKTT